jgi:hypothetical protein
VDRAELRVSPEQVRAGWPPAARSSGCTSEGSSGLRAVALGQFPAYLAHGYADAFDGGADKGDRRVQGVLLSVIT